MRAWNKNRRTTNANREDQQDQQDKHTKSTKQTKQNKHSKQSKRGRAFTFSFSCVPSLWVVGWCTGRGHFGSRPACAPPSPRRLAPCASGAGICLRRAMAAQNTSGCRAGHRHRAGHLDARPPRLRLRDRRALAPASLRVQSVRRAGTALAPVRSTLCTLGWRGCEGPPVPVDEGEEAERPHALLEACDPPCTLRC